MNTRLTPVLSAFCCALLFIILGASHPAHRTTEPTPLKVTALQLKSSDQQLQLKFNRMIEEELTIGLFNIHGMEVVNQKIKVEKGMCTINMADFPSGLYVALIEGEGQLIQEYVFKK